MVITENQDQVKRQPSGEYVRMVDINANSTEIANGIATADYCAGSSLLNSETGEVYLLTEYNDGTKAWNKIGGGGGGTYQVKTATVNGDVTPDSGYDALSKVTVAVPNGTETGNFTANGTYTPTSPNIGFSSVVVNVSGGGGAEEIVARTVTTYSSDTLTSVGDYGLYHYSTLTGVTLPAVTSVGTYAFAYSGITTISLPLCTSLGTGAFSGCESLVSVSLPVVTQLSNGQEFYECSSLTTLNAPELLSISENAFAGCGFTTITLPKCTTINSFAFNRCASMTSFSAPLCTSLGNAALNSCGLLTSVNLPVCANVGDSAFENCSEMVTLSLPAATTLGELCFAQCSNMQTLTLGSLTMTRLPRAIFTGCSAITTFPADILACTSMYGDGEGEDDGRQFSECVAMTTLTMPSCVNIAPYSFNECLALTSVSFPLCTKIGSSAFNGCDVFADLYLNSVATVTSVESDSFGGTAHATPINIHVPSALVSAFQADTNWAYLVAQGFVTVVSA